MNTLEVKSIKLSQPAARVIRSLNEWLEVRGAPLSIRLERQKPNHMTSTQAKAKSANALATSMHRHQIHPATEGLQLRKQDMPCQCTAIKDTTDAYGFALGDCAGRTDATALSRG